jgi:peptide/nickel transport system substrate-binding protein
MAADDSNRTGFTRRDILKLGATAVAGQAVAPFLGEAAAEAQTPKRGGIFRMAGFDPPHFDPQATPHWWTFIALSFTHSRLVKVKAGPGVAPGTLPVEGDLAESWTQPDDNTWVFKLRKGVRWHNKPPVNGRELTADDIKYTYERAMTLKGNPQRGMVDDIERVDMVDRYTVKFTTKAPYAWFLDSSAQIEILPREAGEKFGDFKRPESVIGTGPWILERYDPNVRIQYVRNPQYFVPGLPYADGAEITIDPDPASRFAAWMSGRYDFGPELLMVIRRAELDQAKRKQPRLQTAEFIWPTATIGVVKLDEEPFKDVRVRRAMAMACDSRSMAEANPFGLGQAALNPAVPAAFREWAIPIDQLPPDGRRNYEYNPREAKALLAQAGYANGFKMPVESSASWGPDMLDVAQIMMRNWKEVGIESDLKLKESGAFIASVIGRKFEKAAITLRGGASSPDFYLVAAHLPGQPLNVAGVNDPKLTEMIKLQRRTFDVVKRREIVYDIQRYLSQQVYYLYPSPSAKVVGAWEPYVKNYMPNISLDYGGRLMAAWLDK